MLIRRLAARHGHFFPEKLLGTQLDDLDPPQPDEHVISVAEAASQPARSRLSSRYCGLMRWGLARARASPAARAVIMKLKLDLHDVYNRGQDIDRALQAIIDEAVAKKAPLVEIIPGKGSGQLKKHVLRFLEQKEIKAKYHRVEKDSKNFGRLFVHFRW